MTPTQGSSIRSSTRAATTLREAVGSSPTPGTQFGQDWRVAPSGIALPPDSPLPDVFKTRVVGFCIPVISETIKDAKSDPVK